MKECIRMTAAEFLKYRRTRLQLLHVLLPMIAICLFTVYYNTHNFDIYEEWSGYIEILAVALPAVISVICAMSAAMEEKGHFAVLLGTGEMRINALLAKWVSLSVLELFALVLAIGGFWTVGAWRYGFVQAILWTIIMLWLCSQSIYLFQLFLCLNFSGNTAMCIGVFQSLLAALMQTGLGDGIWQFFPCAFGGRWSGFVLSSFSEKGMVRFNSEAYQCMALNVTIAVGTAIAVVVWFQFFEGRRKGD